MNQLSGSGRPPVSDVNIAICPPEQAEQIRLAENVLGTPPNRGYNHLAALQRLPSQAVEGDTESQKSLFSLLGAQLEISDVFGISKLGLGVI